jgi:hypothetical protein
MRQVMVRYKVKPERVTENEELVRAVYAELKGAGPDGFQYATFKLDDGVSFVHLAMSEGESPLPDLEAFRRFQANIEERCDEPPVVTALTEIGSFRVVGSAA